jgi:hypothetical protein
LVAILGVIACLSGTDAVQAQTLIPSLAFLQVGTTGHTHEGSAGLRWDWSKGWPAGAGRLTGFWEGSVSRWSYPSIDGRQTAWLAKIGLTPVFRYRPRSGTSAWFAEGGVGANVTTAHYETEDKRFSTSFNFGSHVGLGLTFGPRHEHEVVLRVEHFSNAGIRHPNPGENFVQFRYAYRLR